MRQRLALAIVTLTLLAGSAFAQTLPPGKWWRRPEIATELALSAEQQTRLDSIFAAAADDLIDARGDQEKAEIALRTELEQTQPNRDNVRKIVTRLNDARSRKFTREVMMLVDMRAVLSEQQWAQLRGRLDAQRGQAQQQRPRLRRQ